MNLCIIGAGPKALAIASKAAALTQLGFKPPHITLIEKDDIAANWKAGSGLTNGRLPLGTAPDKDVGFPYLSFYWGSGKNDQVNQAMQAYSWSRFLIDHHRYAEWIDRGRPAPTHTRWSEYLTWVYRKVAGHITLVRSEATAIVRDGSQWRISTVTDTVVADGLVLTGPGKPRQLPNVVEDPRIYSIDRFWHDAKHLKGQSGARFAVVGTGENAASIAVTLGSADVHIDVISPVAMSYSRGESYVENHVYTDPFQGNWFQLTLDNRREFINRTDRGVFSVVTKEVLDRLECVEVVPGRMAAARVDALNQLLLTIEYDRETETRLYDYLIVATGFDPAGALEDLLGHDAVQSLVAAAGVTTLEDSIDENLAVAGSLPKLHLPMLAGLNQGPGFPNLSCLGRLSDQILAAYVDLNV